MFNHDVSERILRASFRANPGYDLVVFDRLPDHYRQMLHDLQSDPDFYGVLWPQQSGLGVKSVDQATALLYLTLQQPGPIPTYVRSRFGARCAHALAELVLDGVLEIGWSDAGPFVSGAAAHELLAADSGGGLSQGRIGRLSRAALEYAQELRLDSSSQISARLYFYNTVPRSARWRRRLPDQAEVLRFLDLAADAPLRSRLEQDWIALPPARPDDLWLRWRSRHTQLQAAGWTQPVSYKLYISPVPDALPDTLRILLPIIGDAPIHSFKVGGTLPGLLRPDKLVVYCSRFEDLAGLAARLQAALAGCDAQGVPFTAEIDAEGVLSWGTDPPPAAQLPHWQGQESWRLWITNRLAVALRAAQAEASTIPAWQFALGRLRLDGVDTNTWTPQQRIWAQESGA